MGRSSVRSASAPNGVRALRMALPVTPAPTTRTRAPLSSGTDGTAPLGADGTEPLSVEQRHTQTTGDGRQQPEPDDHRRLRPAHQLEVVVEGRHPEHPAAGG